MAAGTFADLSPQIVIDSVESSIGVQLDGTVQPYNSYVNRVFGVRTDDGTPLIAKYYRPGRWLQDAITDEHQFLGELASSEVPVIEPIAHESGRTLFDTQSGDHRILFAVFPKRGGRNFDPESDTDWFRLGGIVGRMHQVGKRRAASHRLACIPGETTAAYVNELITDQLVHPEQLEEFVTVCESTIKMIDPLFRGVETHRVHGDCHRGNILDRADEGLLLIDFDDMMTAPSVQDLWLLLPGRADDARREIAMFIDGYEQFSSFDSRNLRLIEPLRFMRMIYYLAWQARQRDDFRFRDENPGWGTRAFWLREVEDLKEQVRHLEDAESSRPY